jgi:hypothetical protein
MIAQLVQRPWSVFVNQKGHIVWGVPWENLQTVQLPVKKGELGNDARERRGRVLIRVKRFATQEHVIRRGRTDPDRPHVSGGWVKQFWMTLSLRLMTRSPTRPAPDNHVHPRLPSNDSSRPPVRHLRSNSPAILSWPFTADIIRLQVRPGW